jgi:filamentous hemagglutinin family protein
MISIFWKSKKILCCAMMALCCFSGAAIGNPTAGQVTSGSAIISQSGNTLTVQNSSGAIINWQEFSIAPGSSVNFVQASASSSVLNRVVGVDPTQILGQLTSNGKVYIINPSGVLFGTSAMIDPGALATSTSTPADATSLGISTNMQVSTGWNFLGNSTDAPLNVATAMGDANMIHSVWKWIATTGKWAFYSPSLDGQALADYAASKGYDVLGSINSGEGFWVNAKMPFVYALPLGNLLPATTAQTPPTPGWSMVSVGQNTTPSVFNTSLSSTSPGTGTTPTNLTSLWAWDNAQSNWYFYAPSLEAQGGTALADYNSSKGYRDFNAASKTLGPGMGFWVNKP